MTSRKSVNPDVHDSRKIINIAGELITGGLVDLDWSVLYGESTESVTAFRDVVAGTLAYIPTMLLRESAPLLVDYLLEDCWGNVHNADWMSIAMAVDNVNGMYHPIRITKLVWSQTDE